MSNVPSLVSASVQLLATLRTLDASVVEQWPANALDGPTIVVQAKNDAIADPKSCHYFYEHIASEKKELYNPDTGDHSIALTEGRHEAFRRTAMFLESL